MDHQACEVWLADPGLHRPAHDALLDEAERSRADAFVRVDDRSSFVVGAALLKLAVAGRTGVAPESVRVDRRCPTCGKPHGRPRVPGADVHVSVSRSGSLVAAALTRAGPVGVDVERRPADRLGPLARRILTAAEPVDRADDLLTYWCRKESVLKATGEGLRIALREVIVSPASEPARLVSYRGSAIDAAMADLDVADTHAAALTVLTHGRVSIDIRSAAFLLRA
jgi:4'-phosphopantetheinyl transferase